jgi:hypothetical protein
MTYNDRTTDAAAGFFKKSAIFVHNTSMENEESSSYIIITPLKIISEYRGLSI